MKKLLLFQFAIILVLLFPACGGDDSGLISDGDSDEIDSGESEAEESDPDDSETGTCDLPTWKIEATPDALVDHCRSMKEAECARAFDDCPDLWLYGNEYPDLEICQTEAPQDFCSNSKWDVSYINPTEAQKCLDAIPGADCDEFEQEGGLEECWWYEQPVPPDPALCTMVAPGTYTKTFDVEASRYLGDYVILLCVCVNEGQELASKIVYDSDGGASTYVYDTEGNQLPRSLSGISKLTADKSGAYVIMYAQTAGNSPGAELTFKIEVE